jgi:glutamyl-Q tRNA(Asp) synthetase
MAPARTVITRFAPSPSGHLHLGHAFAALFAAERAGAAGGVFLLRIEDIDAGRCRPEYEAAIFEDLAWLGLTWEEPVRRQSDHLAGYAQAIERLAARGLLYPCFCTRKQIAAEIASSPAAPHGSAGPPYPGTCRALGEGEGARRVAVGDAYALRLKMDDAIAAAGRGLTFDEAGQGAVPCDPAPFGDVVLARKDIATSYHLAVTVDDAIQGVTLVTRGRDLFDSTHVHRLLQALLDLPAPTYEHHRLIADDAGTRLAKRSASQTLRALREAGVSPDEVRRNLGYAKRP